MGEEKEILLRGNVRAYLTCRLMGDPISYFLSATLGTVDIVLVEGFHNEARVKIEVRSARNDAALCEKDKNLLAVVAPEAHPASVPSFVPEDIRPIADFIERNILAGNSN